MTFDDRRLRGLLEELHGHWVRNRAPVAEHLQPGLTEAELDTVQAATGLRIPPELRVWWGWHNGTSPRCSIGPGPWLYLPINDALALSTYHHTGMEQTRAYAPELPAWAATYFPFTNADSAYNDVLFVDTDQDPNEASPIWYYTPVWETSDAPRVPSLADAVQIWVDLLESDAWHWNAEEDDWDYVDERIPRDVRRTRII